MPRDIPIGNGNILIAFDKFYRIRDFYFPHVGQENHTGKDPYRMGVWVNGLFSWVGEDWLIDQDYLDDSLVTEVVLENAELGVRIVANDLVDFHENIYLKRLTIENLTDAELDLRVFFCHDYHIYGNDIGDTAAYRPETGGVLHYKDRRYFLANVMAGEKSGVERFSIGKNEHGKFCG
ncbi:MAG: glycoside hydrolase family 15 protein, partial [Thermodesulfobacteriota bacterium]